MFGLSHVKAIEAIFMYRTHLLQFYRKLYINIQINCEGRITQVLYHFIEQLCKFTMKKITK